MLENRFELGSVIKDIKLESSKTTGDAFKFLLDQTRFDWFEYYNNTVRWTAKLVLFTGTFEGNWQQPAGYVRDTGVTVGGSDVYPHQNTHVILQPQIRCQATRVKCSAHLTNNDTGRDFQLNHPDLVAPPGNFIVGARFAVKEGSTLKNPDNQFEVVIELIDDNSKIHLTHLKMA